MKKIFEKVALIAELCISLIFILTTVLYMTNAIPQQANWRENGVMSVVMIVLAVVFLAIAAYLLYANLSERENLKRILLFSDCESATHTNVKVVYNIVHSCAKQVDGLTVRKIRINSDEKGGYVASIFVKVSAASVAESVNKLRNLLAENFKSTLDLSFNTINFHVEKLHGDAPQKAPAQPNENAQSEESRAENNLDNASQNNAEVLAEVVQKAEEPAFEPEVKNNDDLIGA